MAKGFINVTHSQNGDLGYFAREKECSYILSSDNLSFDKEVLLNQWKQKETQEKLGDKELGIRGRHDARIRTNYTLSLPNELSPQQGAERIKNIIDQTPIKSCSYSIFIHRGQKEGVTNQHAHLIVNERDLKTMKKDREMQRKEWLEKTFRPLFEKEFAQERKQGINYQTRERIEIALFQADLSHSQRLVKDLYSQQEKTPQIKDLTPQNDQWQELFNSYQRINEAKQWKDLTEQYAKLSTQEEKQEQIQKEKENTEEKSIKQKSISNSKGFSL